ncbi:MAG: hypothetical protein HUK07_05245, partial [Bacteroidaceae bacterium]|nr:hypothetical protein [Bacteroidaceae bacterium]
GDIKKDDFWKPIRKFIKKGHAGDSQIFFNKNGDKTFGIRLEKNEWEYTKKKWLFFPKLYLELSICYEVLLVFFLIYTFAQNGFRLSYAEIEDHAKIACVPVALPVAVIALPYAIYDEVKKQIKYYEEEQKRFYDLTHDADTTIYYNELVKKNEK